MGLARHDVVDPNLPDSHFERVALLVLQLGVPVEPVPLAVVDLLKFPVYGARHDHVVLCFHVDVRRPVAQIVFDDPVNEWLEFSRL